MPAKTDPMLPGEQAEKIATTLKALAHPMRLQIVALLEGREMTVGEIVEALGAKHSITSQQLGLMKDRGVLACRREGMYSYYRIHNPRVLKLLGCVREKRETEEN